MKLGNISWVVILSSVLSNVGYASYDVQKKFNSETAREVLLALTKAAPLSDDSRPLLKALLNGQVNMTQLSQTEIDQLNNEISEVSKVMIQARASII